MNQHPDLRRFSLRRAFWPAGLLALAATGLPAQSGVQAPAPAQPVVLDRVIAVVNDHAILASDLKEEILLAVLEPNDSPGAESPEQALQRLISRSLIRQQIRDEDAQTTAPTDDEVESRLVEMRRELPVCVRELCATDEGWTAFLAHHELTEKRVTAYLRSRMQTLRFIEMRFRQGIRITDQEISGYYRDTLVPQYPVGKPAPALGEVSARIQEILLQQKVNAMFNDWLDSLRQQGEVEVLDPSLEAAAKPDHEGTAAQ
jgi:peptidyl-prolyl cis-trans isomerase SurA